MYSKTCLKGPLKMDKTKILKTSGNLVKVEVLQNALFNTFDLHLAIMGLENQFLVFFLSGCVRPVLLYITSTEYCTYVQYSPFKYKILHECSCFIEFNKRVEEKR